jgi:hypothetical protein
VTSGLGDSSFRRQSLEAVERKVWGWRSRWGGGDDDDVADAVGSSMTVDFSSTRKFQDYWDTNMIKPD